MRTNPPGFEDEGAHKRPGAASARILVALAAAVGALAACSERQYQYKTEKEWVAELGAKEPRRRVGAADALGAMEASSDETRRALVGALSDQSSTVRVYAAKSLSRLKESGELRTTILDMLLREASDTLSEAQLGALEALAIEEYRDERSLPVLVAALKNRSAATRATAAASLGQFGDRAETTVLALQAVLRDSSEVVQHEARDALAAITGRRKSH